MLQIHLYTVFELCCNDCPCYSVTVIACAKFLDGHLDPLGKTSALCQGPAYSPVGPEVEHQSLTDQHLCQ